MSLVRPCKKCGLDVVIVEVVSTHTGEVVILALDPRAKVYHVVKDQDGPDLSTKATGGRVLVYHGAVCKGANRGTVSKQGG